MAITTTRKSKITLNKAADIVANSFERITRNLSSKYTRTDTLEGREYIVCPMVMGVEGVLVGNNGPGLYLGEDWEKFGSAWDHKPVVVYHPEIAGKGVSACSPQVLNSSKIGIVLNTRWDSRNSKLRAEAWIDKEKTGQVDKRVLDAISANSMMEVSTGLFCDQQMQSGLHTNGRKYDWIARNHRPDHLAILPDQIGACSIADGAGLLQLNSSLSMSEVRVLLAKAHSLLVNKSYGQIMSELQKLIGKSVSVDSFVSEVYDSYVVYYFAGDYYAVAYEVKDDVVSLVGSPEKVTEGSRTFMKLSGEVIANSKGIQDMAKKDLIDAAIQSGKFLETERTFLEGLDDARLSAFVPPAAPAPQAPAPAPAPAPVAPTAQAPAPAPAPAKPVTVEEYLASAPPELQDTLRVGLQTHNSQKQALIATILANKANTFPAERLNTMVFGDLQALAAFAQAPAPQAPMANNYLGQGYQPTTVTTNASNLPEALTMPTIDWSKPK
jgi:hypothetical protein